MAACDVSADNCTDGQTGYHKVTVMVTDVNERGKVTLATNTANGTPQYLVGATLTATVSDGDITNTDQGFTVDKPGEVTGVTWRWYRGGTEITGAATNSYQLLPADAGQHIRVVVTYQVGANTKQESASLTTDYPVLAAPGWGQPAQVRPGRGVQDHQRGGQRQERRYPGDGHGQSRHRQIHPGS